MPPREHRVRQTFALEVTPLHGLEQRSSGVRALGVRQVVVPQRAWRAAAHVRSLDLDAFQTLREAMPSPRGVSLPYVSAAAELFGWVVEQDLARWFARRSEAVVDR